jgi:hypothetical protein
MIVNMAKMSNAPLPNSAARCRKSCTYFLTIDADGPETNTHSACLAAKSFPRREAPAW